MDYETAKKLRDAGFPQEINEGSFYFAGRNLFHPYCWGGDGEDKPYGEYWLVPNLEELIAECGDGFQALTRDDRNWTAIGFGTYASGFEGSTPKAAVANLYLALNPIKPL